MLNITSSSFTERIVPLNAVRLAAEQLVVFVCDLCRDAARSTSGAPRRLRDGRQRASVRVLARGPLLLRARAGRGAVQGGRIALLAQVPLLPPNRTAAAYESRRAARVRPRSPSAPFYIRLSHHPTAQSRLGRYSR